MSAVPVGLLYDIHGNLPALEAVLGDAGRAGVESFVLGGDYLGVDVTVAARLCEAAGESEILLSNDVAQRIDQETARVEEPAPVLEKGTPDNLRVFRIGA